MVDLRSQTATRVADPVAGVFAGIIRKILVIRSGPCVLLRTAGVRRVLVSTIGRPINGNIPIDITSRVGVIQDLGQAAVPRSAGSVASVAFAHCLPGAEVYAWNVPLGDARPILVGDFLDDPAIVLERTASLAGIGGQERLDAFPLRDVLG